MTKSSLDGSFLNNFCNIPENNSLPNESFISKNSNPFNILNSNVPNNFGLSNNNINNNLNNIGNNLAFQQQINNRLNQMNSTNNINNIYGVLGSNQNILNNMNYLGNNNFNNLNLLNFLNNNIIYQLILTSMDSKAWGVYNKDGSAINKYNSFELLKFFTDKIINNIKLDNYIIRNNNSEKSFNGGELYIYLLNFLPYVFQFLEEQCLNRIEYTKMNLVANNLNNTGAANLFTNNNNLNYNFNNLNNNINLNNNNFLTNNLKNN